MSGVLDELRRRAAIHPRRVIFPETHDQRVIEAAAILADRGWATPVLLDPPARADLPRGVEAVTRQDASLLETCVAQLVENRRHRAVRYDDARAMLDNPLLLAALLVKIGHADASVAGSVAATADVIRAAMYGVGTAPGRQLVSSFFLMDFVDRAVTYADCGVVPDPTADQLAEIAVTAAASHQQLTGHSPRVAFLSYSTKGSAAGGRVEKVREAMQKARQLAPHVEMDGELQFDAAWVPEVASRKAPGSPVAGQANVFIFPDLDSGNIAYKITERLGGATALGPLLQGLAKPCMDLSRGCKPMDIVDVAVIASILAE